MELYYIFNKTNFNNPMSMFLLLLIHFGIMQFMGSRLRTVDNIGNCQRLALIVGVSQHMHKVTNL